MLAAVLACGALTSCQDDMDAPEMKVPVATLKPNTTIAEVKEAFWQDGDNYIASIGAKDNGEHYIISDFIGPLRQYLQEPRDPR